MDAGRSILREREVPLRSLRAERWFFVGCLVPLHLFVVSRTVGLRGDHLFIDGVAAGLYLAGARPASLVRALLPFWFVLFLYDCQPLVRSLRGEVHVADLHQLELSLFGLEVGGRIWTLPELLGQHLHPALDLVAGLTYLLYLPQVLLSCVYLYFRDYTRMVALSAGFFVVNLWGLITYLMYPAAPPWYVDRYGLGPAQLDVPASAARAARVDALFGWDIFGAFYGRSTNVFGAMPSLHCAYPILVLLALSPLGVRHRVAAGGYAAVMIFAAVYLNHHYLIDAVVGVGYGAVTWGVVTALQRWAGGWATVKGAIPDAATR